MHAVLPETCRKFFDHHQGHQLWLNQHSRLIDWKHKLVVWRDEDRAKAQTQPAQAKAPPAPRSAPPAPLWQQIKSTEALLEEAKTRLARISVPDRHLYPEGYAKACEQRNPILNELAALKRRLTELHEQASGKQKPT